MYYIALGCLRLPYSSLCCFTFSIHYQTLPFIANSKRLHYVAIFCLTIRCLIIPNIAFRCGHISLNCLAMHSRTASAQGKARALGCNHIVVLGWQLHKLVSQSQCGGNLAMPIIAHCTMGNPRCNTLRTICKMLLQPCIFLFVCHNTNFEIKFNHHHRPQAGVH